jgi:hypothetical protein
MPQDIASDISRNPRQFSTIYEKFISCSNFVLVRCAGDSGTLHYMRVCVRSGWGLRAYRHMRPYRQWETADCLDRLFD